VSVTLADDEARALAVLVARVLVLEAREHGARPTGAAVELLRRLTLPPVTPQPQEAAETLCVTEAAQRMGCSPAYVRRLAATGRIGASKIGPAWAVRWPATVAPPQPDNGRSSTIAA
jgi:excisionase family DNA binding protein